MTLIWVDTETTGLDPQKDCLLEVALVVTDDELSVLDDPFSIVVRPTFAAYDGMPPVVREMHRQNGLLDELDDALGLPEAQTLAEEYLSDFNGTADTAPLAGNNVGFDRGFLAAHMPRLLKFAHYRNVDVSTVKELAWRWYPEIIETAPAKTGGHRALPDILDSIEELRHYRSAGLFAASYVARKGIVDAPVMPELLPPPVTQPVEIVYADPTAASGTIPAGLSPGHVKQCKVCRILKGLSPDAYATVDRALNTKGISADRIAQQFGERGAQVSEMSVVRHRQALRRGAC